MQREVAALDRKPGLATVLVGDDPASHVYVRNKRKACEEVGHRVVPPRARRRTSRRSELAELLRRLNADDRVRRHPAPAPVPGHIDQDAMIELIDPRKDVDGLTTANAGLLVQGRDGPRAVHPRRA